MICFLFVKAFCLIDCCQEAQKDSKAVIALFDEMLGESGKSYYNIYKYKKDLQNVKMDRCQDEFAESCAFLLRKALVDCQVIEANPGLALELQKMKLAEKWERFRKLDFEGRLKLIGELRGWEKFIRSNFQKGSFLDYLVNTDICYHLGMVQRDYPFEEKPTPCMFQAIEAIEKDFDGTPIPNNIHFRRSILFAKIRHFGNCQKCGGKLGEYISEYEKIQALFPPKKADQFYLVLYKLEDLFFQKKYQECVQFFKNSIMFTYLNKPTDRNGHILYCMIRGYSFVGRSHKELGQKELGKTYQELALTTGVIASIGENGYSDLESIRLMAEDLRKMYLEDKQWELMRSLEERSAKFGMKPLPKQPGE